MRRRTFLQATGAIIGGLYVTGCNSVIVGQNKLPFKISLAQWSLHRRLFGEQEPKMDNLEFAAATRGYGIDAVEYVNQFFKDKAQDKNYLAEMKKRQTDNGITAVLIMCDGEGHLGDPDGNKRKKAVENHYKWLEAAKYLGCHSIRVNAHSEGSYDEQLKLAADGLYQLTDYARQFGLNVIVENHGGLSSNGQWLSSVMKKVNLPNCGTLPDFGNFHEYDRYKGIAELMPFAKGVSAKSHDFDDEGNEIHTDFYRAIKIVLDAGYNGYIDVEYEGSKLSEDDGIIATKKLLERVRNQFIQA
ncbi:MAG: sugar phosphate isomerase/epimerase [Sedimentisphaerales bacterium]|nr:sugar phosphate isomerase/epimerase [Sedimentisphaerales bacterium]